MKKSLLITFVGFACASAATADLIWSADFESYNTKHEPAPLIINSSGKDDTFTAVLPNSRMKVGACEVRSDGSPSFMDGNALYLEGDVIETGNASLRIRQNKMDTISGAGAIVISFDVYCPHKPVYSLIAEVNTNQDGRTGSMLYSPQPKSETIRATIIINCTSNSLTLPGDLGSLNTNSCALYFYDGVSYSGLKISDGDVTSYEISGFSVGLSRSNFEKNDVAELWIDNVGVWNSIDDSISGTSVLELKPGVVVK